MKVKAKIFLERHGDYVIGPGRIELLRAIEELGSLRKAANKLGMSYRWAWGRLKHTEDTLGTTLMTRTTKKIGGKPNMLTDDAKALLTWYDKAMDMVSASLATAEEFQPAFLLKRKCTARLNKEPSQAKPCME